MESNQHFDWFIKLLWNLYGYSTILIPLMVIVYMVKHKYCLPIVSNFAITRILVYGKDVNTVGFTDVEQSKSLLDNEKKESAEKSIDQQDDIEARRKKMILFSTCFLGLNCSYLIWGVFQEKIMTTEYLLSVNTTQFLKQINDPHWNSGKVGDRIRFKESEFLILFARIFAFAVSSYVFTLSQTRKPKDPWDPNSKRFVIAPFHEFFYSALSNILSSWCQYEALKYVNFPTQVLSKACKIPAVMFMSKVISGKKYEPFEYVAAFSISLGMILFLHGNHDDNHSRSPMNPEELSSSDSTSKLFSGLFVLAFYLVFDSFTSNWEEKIYHKYHISSWQMMAAVNFCSVVLTLTSLTQQGKLVPALKLISYSRHLARDCLFLAISATVGQFFVFFTISRFGALIFTMIMTCRQIFAILLSFIIYHHSISLLSILGVIVVFTSIMTMRLVKISKVKK